MPNTTTAASARASRKTSQGAGSAASAAALPALPALPAIGALSEPSPADVYTIIQTTINVAMQTATQQIQSQVGTMLATMSQSIDNRFEKLEGSIETIDGRLDTLDASFPTRRDFANLNEQVMQQRARLDKLEDQRVSDLIRDLTGRSDVERRVDNELRSQYREQATSAQSQASHVSDQRFTLQVNHVFWAITIIGILSDAVLRLSGH